jgi:hypothetical protein
LAECAMGDNATVDGAGAGGTGSHSEGQSQQPVRTRRGSAIVPPAHWIGQEAAPRTAFVTGASSGLGLALVKAFIAAGFRVRRLLFTSWVHIYFFRKNEDSMVLLTRSIP